MDKCYEPTVYCSFKAYKDATNTQWSEFTVDRYKILARGLLEYSPAASEGSDNIDEKLMIVSNSVAENETSKQKLIIISTFMRSGSTFVGELFNLHSEVFYQFEPLHADAAVLGFFNFILYLVKAW